MYNIKYSKKSIEQIRLFVKNFHNKNIQLLSGGGIFAEKQMIQTYLIGAEALREKIFEKCNDSLLPEIVPKRYHEGDKNLCILNMGNLRLFVYYLENSDQRIRTIKSIEFYKK